MRTTFILKLCVAVLLALMNPCRVLAEEAWNAPASQPGGPIVMRVVMIQDQDDNPFAAGKTAAEALQGAMDGVALKAVIVSECFEDQGQQGEVAGGRLLRGGKGRRVRWRDLRVVHTSGMCGLRLGLSPGDRWQRHRHFRGHCHRDGNGQVDGG